MTPLEALRVLGTGDDAPLASKERVHGALMASFAAAAAAAAAVGAAELPKAPASLSPAPLAAGIASVAGSKTLVIAASIWLFGGLTGAALYGALRPSPVRVVYVDRQVPAASVASLGKEPDTLAPADSVTPLSALSSRSPAGRAALPRAARPAGQLGSQLAQERALLDLARSNAARGEPELALEQVERHRQLFAQGHLTEEREALGIRALLSLGRKQEAQERAQAFRLAYPNSFLLPVIDSAVSAP